MATCNNRVAEHRMQAWLRKHWLRLLICCGLIYCPVHAVLIEPYWVRINRLALSEPPSLRIVHISDLHYKGAHRYLPRIIRKVNSLPADVVCFTGDIVENARYLDEALDALGKIKAPLYGVPGNHDYWSGITFDTIETAFQRTGGDWLMDRSVTAAKGGLLITGRSGAELVTGRTASAFAMPGQMTDWDPPPATDGPSAKPPGAAKPAAPKRPDTPTLLPTAKKLLLTHYPATADSIKGQTYDLILAGHVHGGQVRLPFIGALILPFGVNGHQLGTYETPAGPLHVSSGLGTFFLPARLFCRPEITLIEL